MAWEGWGDCRQARVLGYFLDGYGHTGCVMYCENLLYR